MVAGYVHGVCSPAASPSHYEDDMENFPGCADGVRNGPQMMEKT
jgi:hypothetical protein